MALAIVSVTHTAFTTDTTAHLVAMPATVNAGDLLITLIATDGSATLTTPSGWTNLSSVPQSTTVRGSCSYKIAVGTEGGTTVDYVTTATEQAAAQVYRITGHLEIIGQLTAGTAVGSVNAGVATIDAPAVTAPWGVLSADNLFITYAATSGTQAIVNQPTGWSTPEKTSEGGYGQGAASAEMFSSWLLSPSATLDPASWTTSATGAISLSNTIVIRPRIGTVGLPVSIVVGTTQTTGTTQALTIPVATAGNILLIQSHGRRSSTTLAPGPPSVSDTSAAPLAWTPVFSPLPTQVGVNPGTAAQWWWAVADGASKTVTVTWPNASTSVCIQSSVASFTVGAGLAPSFANQAFAGSTGTPNAPVTATFPAVPTTGINMLSFAGAGGSSSTIATGYTSLAAVAASPYRTGYDMTPGADAVMGANFLDQMVAAVNITEGGEVAVGTGQEVTASVGTVSVDIGVNADVIGNEVAVSVGTVTVDVPAAASQTVTITDTADDGYAWKNDNADPPQWDSTWVEHIDYVGDDYKERFGLRFPGFSIPTGQQVVTATLTLHLQYAKPTGYIYGVAADTAPVFDDTNNPFDVPKTGASTKLNLDHDIEYNPVLDVAPIIGEIIGRGGWASGNAIGFVSGGPFTVPENAQYIGLYDVNDGPGSTLFIEWEPSPLNIAYPYSTVAVVSVGTVRVSISAGSMSFICEDGDDGHVTADIGHYFDQGTILQGMNASDVIKLLALRFQQIPIPQGSGITSAILHLYGATGPIGGGTSTGQYGYLKGEDADNCTPWVTISHTPKSIVLTSARVPLWANGAFGYDNAFDVTAIVNEIIQRPGWLSSNALGIVGAEPIDGVAEGVGGGWVYFYDSSNDPKTYQPRLELAWAAPAIPVNGYDVSPGLDLPIVFQTDNDTTFATINTTGPFDYTIPDDYVDWYGAPNVSVNLASQAVTVSVGTVTAAASVSTNVTTNLATASVGTVSFQLGVSISVTSTGLTAQLGPADIIAGGSISVGQTTNLVTASVGTVTIRQAVVFAATNLVTTSVGDETIRHGVSTTAATNLLTTSVGNESVIQGLGVSTTAATNLITASVGNETATAIQNMSIPIVMSSMMTVSTNPVTVVEGFRVLVNVTSPPMTASVGNESVAFPMTVYSTGNQVTASMGAITVIQPVTVNVTGQEVIADWGYAETYTVTNVSVTGFPMVVSLGDETISLPREVEAIGFELTAYAGSIDSFILNHNIAVGGYQLTVSQGLAYSTNWGTAPDDERKEDWTEPATGPGEGWVPLPKKENAWIVTPDVPDEIWNRQTHPPNEWTH